MHRPILPYTNSSGAGCGVKASGIFSWPTLEPNGPHLNITAQLSAPADHGDPFLTTMCPFSEGCFHKLTNNVKVQISNWFLEPDNEFGCGETGNSHHGCADLQKLRNVSCTSMNLWIQPGTSEVYLMKCRVSERHIKPSLLMHQHESNINASIM